MLKLFRSFFFDIGYVNKICNVVFFNFLVIKSKMRFIVFGKKIKIFFVIELNNIYIVINMNDKFRNCKYYKDVFVYIVMRYF